MCSWNYKVRAREILVAPFGGTQNVVDGLVYVVGINCFCTTMLYGATAVFVVLVEQEVTTFFDCSNIRAHNEFSSLLARYDCCLRRSQNVACPISVNQIEYKYSQALTCSRRQQENKRTPLSARSVGKGRRVSQSETNSRPSYLEFFVFLPLEFICCSKPFTLELYVLKRQLLYIHCVHQHVMFCNYLLSSLPCSL